MEGHETAYRSIAACVVRNTSSKGSFEVLDFGCGPCDKTAIIAKLGYRCRGIDDFGDGWHTPDAIAKIKRFARAFGIILQQGSGRFETIMLHDVLEHWHDSPKQLLEMLVRYKLKSNGHLIITVPNAGALHKRLKLLMGQTNHPDYGTYYWHPGPKWRGHIREYVRQDLKLLAEWLGLGVVELYPCHHMLAAVPRWLRWPYRLVTGIWRGSRDSWTLVARKPAHWKPVKPEAGAYEKMLAPFCKLS